MFVSGDSSSVVLNQQQLRPWSYECRLLKIWISLIAGHAICNTFCIFNKVFHNLDVTNV